MPAYLEDHGRQLWNEVRVVHRISQFQHEVIAREVDGDRFAAQEGSCLKGDRRGVQFSNQVIEDRLQMWVGRIAGRVSRTPLKEKISGIRRLTDPLRPLLAFIHPYRPFTTNPKDSNLDSIRELATGNNFK